MDTKRESRSCRICGSVVPPTHCVALFGMKSLPAGLADRLSKVADVPVAPDDVLTMQVRLRNLQWEFFVSRVVYNSQN